MDGVKTHFNAEVMSKVGRKPIIVFVEIEDSDFTNYLSELAKQHSVLFYAVYNREAAT